MNATNTKGTDPRAAEAAGAGGGVSGPGGDRRPDGDGQRVLERIVEALARQAAEEYLRGDPGVTSE